MIGARIRLLRERAEETQEEFAALLGVTVQQVWRWESDAQIPRADRLRDIAQHFKTTADYLLGLTNDSSPRNEELTDDERQMLDIYRRRWKESEKKAE